MDHEIIYLMFTLKTGGSLHMKILKRTAHFGDLEIAANPLNTQVQISF